MEVIDGRKKNCKGIISSLEKSMEGMDTGRRVRVVMADVLNRVDVRAWAARNGHTIVEDKADGETYEMVVAK